MAALAAALAAAAAAHAASEPAPDRVAAPLPPSALHRGAPAPGAPVDCWLRGVAARARCGVVRRPLDPSRPDGATIDVHWALLPALSRSKAPDAVAFLAGGPGQSAIDTARAFVARFGRLGRRRDLLFVDQRGTGASASLACPDDAPRAALAPLAEQFDMDRAIARVHACRDALTRRPWGDLRHYHTALASADLDAVRRAIGAPALDLVGISYGTRVALDHLRQFPATTRRVVLDGVAPPGMRLPETFGVDAGAAFDALDAGCAGDARCAAAGPSPRRQLATIAARLPATARLAHPLSGRVETVRIDADALAAMLRAVLYAPEATAALPAALAAAAQRGDFAPLVALTPAGLREGFATGMHYAVMCSEDLAAPAAGAIAAVPPTPPPADDPLARGIARQYARACDGWPRAALPAGFEAIPRASVAVWLLSGGADPATPPRHAERARAALGPNARHLVVPNAGHGATTLGCVADAAQRFVAADDDRAALAVADDPKLADCARALPRVRPLALAAADREAQATGAPDAQPPATPPAPGSRR